MKINRNLLIRLSDRFGIGVISDTPPIQKFLANVNVCIKAPAGFEPVISGAGYLWDDDMNGYKLGNNQKLFMLPDNRLVWIFKDVLFRILNPDSVQKWVSEDSEY